jgi:chemotaxis protein MotB
MGRRESDHKQKGAPAWMTTFGDLMALLLTFFVLMLSLSSINQQKYEAISDVMGESFGLQKIKAPDNTHPTPDGKTSLIEPPIKLFRDTRPVDVVIKQDLGNEIDAGHLSMSIRNGKLTLTFPDRLAFAPGSDQLTPHFADILGKVALILSHSKGDVVVAGYTDNQPINNARFKSNWELSSARAVTVVQALIATGKVEASRLAAVGYADNHPLVPNENKELRAKNRRVEIRLDLPEES